jgi:hypothetical protein
MTSINHELRGKIIGALSYGRMTAREIASRIGAASETSIYSSLLAMRNAGVVKRYRKGNAVPTWGAVPTPSEHETHERVKDAMANIMGGRW